MDKNTWIQLNKELEECIMIMGKIRTFVKDYEEDEEYLRLHSRSRDIEDIVRFELIGAIKKMERTAGSFLFNSKEQKVDKRFTDKQHVWLTVNPREEIPVEKIIEVTHNAMKLAPVGEGRYVFEQRGKTEDDIHGYHIHACFKRKDRPSVIVNEMKRSFKKLTDVENENYFRLYFVDEQKAKVKEKYMDGQKSEKEKLDSVKINPIFRKKYGLMDNYACGRVNSCLAPQPIKSKIRLKII